MTSGWPPTATSSRTYSWATRSLRRRSSIELGVLLADPRMGEELVETLQVYFDAGGNRRETARRLHLADRTVAYRLERAEDLLGHGLEGDAGRRLNVALTLRRLEGLRRTR